MAKNNFILYKDFKPNVDILDNDQAGKLFKAIFAYVEDRTEPNFKDGMLKMAFITLKSQLERDLVKYNNKVKANQENGKKGGLAKVANASKRKRSVANLADSVSDNGSVNDSDSDNVKGKKDKKETIYFVDESLNELFKEFLKQRKSTKVKNTERAITILLNKLEPHNDDIKTKMIEKSILSGWPNLYELNGSKFDKKDSGGLFTADDL